MVCAAMERCAYCRRDVPVTWVDVRPAGGDAPLSARVAVCEGCREDGR